MSSTVRTERRAVVVPAISAPSSVACLRSLGGRGVHTIAVSEDEGTPSFYSAYCDETVVVPSPHEDLLAYKDALLELSTRPDVATIVPVREEDVYVLAAHREEFTPHVATPWPDLETLSRVQDRRRLFEVAADHDVAFPETRLLEEGAATDGGGRPDGGAAVAGIQQGIDWNREWIVKPRYSILAGAYIDGLDPASCLSSCSTSYLSSGRPPDAAAITAEMHHVPLLQEYVPGDEYGFFALYDEGEAVATFQHRQRRGWTYAGGPSAYRESVRIPALEEAGRTLLDALEWHGLAMVEFLRDEDGEFRLMEVNPRFWSSLPFTVRAGADFPADYWRLARGEAVSQPDYEVGIGGHLLRGELLYLRSVLRDEFELVERPSFPAALREVAGSILASPRFDYLVADDPRPFFRDLWNAYDLSRSSEPPAATEPPSARQ
ncbi:ATP-grasp domain-containing protein [Saliphagus sp. LR7]|uniref:carboxylate--amine ligase n=1 Tax=Saliphagus sp. LR7 TaxID=2282654 RepID=UPI000DF84BA9|nr:ATP-grasp domain-containing protein [Saliphagus sp. LR7]